MSDEFNIPSPRLNADKNYVRMHKIRKLEQKIVTLAQILFSVKTNEAKQDTINSMREAVEKLSEAEADDC